MYFPDEEIPKLYWMKPIEFIVEANGGRRHQEEKRIFPMLQDSMRPVLRVGGHLAGGLSIFFFHE